MVDMNLLTLQKFRAPSSLRNVPEIPFGLSIGEGSGETLHECQDLSLVVATAIHEILRVRLLLSAALSLLPGNPGGPRFPLPGFENPAIPFFKCRTDGRQQSMPALLCGIHGRFHPHQAGDPDLQAGEECRLPIPAYH